MPNLGLSHYTTRERFPDGCDWHKPPGCHCRLLFQRAQCCENCDDQITIDRYKAERKMRRVFALLFVAFVVAVIMSLLTSRANSAPLYCKALLKFERSCSGVKLAAASLGENHALALAKRCGATDEEIQQAKACLKK